jgi:ABC-type transport system substrate-binding protein
MRPGQKATPRDGISRWFLMKTAAVGALVMSTIMGAKAADARGTVKVVPEVDLKVFDPVWTTALITGTHALLVYDTLFASDREQRVHPQMVDKYERDEDGLTGRFRLRDGLGWHDGTPVTARDCVASIRRWSVRSATGKVMMDRTERLDALDDNAFILKLKEPFGLVPETLGSRGAAFMMRAKEAEAAPLVLMDPTDQSNLHMLTQVLSEHMKKVGLNVDLQAMDWSTLVSRRAVKTPPPADRGGWHVFPTAWPSAT